MQTNEKHQQITFTSTGRSLNLDFNIIGINLCNSEANLATGYDSCLLSPFDEPLTDEERKELALHMANVWLKWGELQ